ncbi:MAG: pentapeptide repeat-containing protein [Candidatus Saccharibacteria bacterium]
MPIAQPEILESLTVSDALMLKNNAQLEAVKFQNIIAESVTAKYSQLHQVVFEKCHLIEADLEATACSDAVIKDSDFSAVKIASSKITRLHAANNRMPGINLSDSELTDITFDGCNLNLANFRMSKLRRIKFTRCSLVEADFVGSELREIIFEDCELEKVNFYQVKVKNVDFSGSHINGLGGWQSLKGVTIDSLQLLSVAGELAGELGLKIKR